MYADETFDHENCAPSKFFEVEVHLLLFGHMGAVWLVLVSFIMLISARALRISSRMVLRASSADSGVVKAYGKEISYPNFSFEVIQASTPLGDNGPRLGVLKCPHGVVETPNFVFCATKAAMKAVTPDMLRQEGTQFILSNTYHLMLTPGSKIVDKMGKLQKFTGWRGPMLTDSGGYQIFSMGYGSVANEIKGNRNTENLGWEQTLISIDEDGAKFRSYVDGTIHYLTPERSIGIQRELGADFVVVLDECTPFNVDKQYTKDSMRRSHRWAKRSLEEFERGADGTQSIYGIVQGGIYADLRDESIDFVNENPFFGVAIGGSLGANKTTMHDIVAYTRSRITGRRPVHLLGIGGVRDIFNGVRYGVDTFDCVHPTRLGRHGGALVKKDFWDEVPEPVEEGNVMQRAMERKMAKRAARGKAPLPEHELRRKSGRAVLKVKEHINVRTSRFINDPRPLDPTCSCYTCTNFSRAYLHHLFKAKESLGGTLVTLHNVAFMNRLMKDIRHGIKTNTLDQVESEWVHPDLMAELQDGSHGASMREEMAGTDAASATKEASSESIESSVESTEPIESSVESSVESVEVPGGRVLRRGEKGLMDRFKSFIRR
jgi:queuine tRNA-ribosyltransferase